MPEEEAKSFEYHRTYPTVHVDNLEGKQFFVALTNHKMPVSWYQPQTQQGHYYLTLGFIPGPGQAPVFLNGLGKVIRTDFSGIPKILHGVSEILLEHEGAMRMEEFPYDLQHRDKFKVREKMSADHTAHLYGKRPPKNPNNHSQKKSVKKELTVDAYPITFAEFQAIMADFKVDKMRKENGRYTQAYYLLNMYHWSESEKCFRHDYFESILQYGVAQILAAQSDYENVKFALEQKTINTDTGALTNSGVFMPVPDECITGSTKEDLAVSLSYINLKSFDIHLSGDVFKDHYSDIIAHRDGFDSSELIVFGYNDKLKMAGNLYAPALKHTKYPAQHFITLLTIESKNTPYTALIKFLGIHFEQLAKLDDMDFDTANGTVSYQDDLEHAKQLVAQHVEPLFDVLQQQLKSDEIQNEISCNANANAALGKLNELKQALKKSEADAAEIAGYLKDIDALLCKIAKSINLINIDKYLSFRLSLPAKTDFCDATIDNGMRFSYLDNNCMHEAARVMDKHVPGFNRQKYSQNSAKLPNSISHIDGQVIDELPFTPRELPSQLETSFNRYHLIAAQQIYTVLIPYSKDEHKIWWPIYQVLEHEIRHKKPDSISAMKPLADILREKVGKGENLTKEHQQIYNRIAEIAEREKALRQFFTNHTDLEQRLRQKAVDFDLTYAGFFKATDALVWSEPEKTSLVSDILGNLIALDKDPHDQTQIEKLTENLSSVKFPSPLWETFEIGAFGTMGSILAASAVVTFPLNPLAAAGLAFFCVAMVYECVVTTTAVVADQWKDDRTYEATVQSEAMNISSSLSAA